MTRLALAAALALVLWALVEPAQARGAAVAAMVLLAGLGAMRVYAAARRRKRRNTLAGLRKMAPAAFERAVAAWFARDGWLVEHRGRSGDQGIDVMAFRGAEVVAVQCKRYGERGTVSPAQLRELYGAAVAAGATRALLITTGRVSRAATEWAETLGAGSARLDVIAGEGVEAIATGRLRISPGHERI